jgi:maltose phosphorylase
MGQRGTFEEGYAGHTLQGAYMAGIYYPDKTRVGWWKNGYPEYFAKVLNATNWSALALTLDGVAFDLSKLPVKSFERSLNMKEGVLRREVTVTVNGKDVALTFERFVSLVKKEIGAVSCTVKPLQGSVSLGVTLAVDGDVRNTDANYGDIFWEETSRKIGGSTCAALTMATKKTAFALTSAMAWSVSVGGTAVEPNTTNTERDRYIGQSFTVTVDAGKSATLTKVVCLATSRDHKADGLEHYALSQASAALEAGFSTLRSEHTDAWSNAWKNCDIEIEGDVSAQQAIRFNIFQLLQTYTGHDARLNIGPKGFTGEKYGGSTYWDTEAYCIPFYLSSCDSSVALNLLEYRYNHLERAKENAKKLGIPKGALYPMVTMTGEECHNEWEITFEEIHRNGAIAHAIFQYTRYTGDVEYQLGHGAEVLCELARFWECRVTRHADRDCYMILGVTGPNEYENNVNNNWYTNRIAAWTLDYALETLATLQSSRPAAYKALVAKIGLTDAEQAAWKDISAKMYYPICKERNIFLQQDGFLDKEIAPVSALNPEDRPINQKWSWDKILRSCYIKQADVLQGLYFLGHLYDKETKRSNFNFYEPLTVHESSLSPCVHTILACELGNIEKAYEMYLRTARLDLDNYNNDTEDGCHITSMAGTWMAVVYGFAGLKVTDGKLSLSPNLPGSWKGLNFGILFRGARLTISIQKGEVTVNNASSTTVECLVNGKALAAVAGQTARMSLGCCSC